MADKNIGALPAISGLDDDSLLVVEQQGTAGKLTGAQFKQFARAGVSQYVEAAQAAADRAEAASLHSPAVGDNGNWYVWDTDAGAYMDSGTAATGPSGANGETGPQGVGVAYAVVDSDNNLIITLTNGQTVDAGSCVGPEGPQGETGETGDPGSSIQSIKRTGGTGASGTTDTYTITLTDGSTTTFQVYNGMDGEGAGDMTTAVYDPQGKKTDLFAYVDNAVQAATEEEIDAAMA